MAEPGAAPPRGEPLALSPELRQQGWSIRQTSEGDWDYVHTAPDGRTTTQWERPGLPGRNQADLKYVNAVEVAVAKCAADTPGQRCYICTEAVKEETNEGLVSEFCACRGDLRFAHVSCLAELAKRLVEKTEANNRGVNELAASWARWHTCHQCKQRYHGVVACALGWACWKTYVGRPERDWFRGAAMSELGNGLYETKRHEDELAVREAVLSMVRRVGTPRDILTARGNLAITYFALRRDEEALSMRQEVYYSHLEMLHGEENEDTLREADDYALSLLHLGRFEEVHALLRKTTPVARRVLGENHFLTLRMRCKYVQAIYWDPVATLDRLREAVTTLEDVIRIARQVLGGEHPLTANFEDKMRDARAALRAREAPDDDETTDVSAQEDDADDAESPTPVAAPMPAEATVAPRPPPPLPRPLPRRVTSILCCW